MGDPIDKQFGDWFGSNYGESQPSMPPPTTPPPSIGFSPYADGPAPFMGYSGQGYRPFSPPDSQGFGRFPTPPDSQCVGAAYATQGLDSMNLAASFESVSGMPDASQSKGKAKVKGKGRVKVATRKVTEPELLPSGRRAPVQYSPEETLCLANAWVAISEDPTKGNDQTGDQFWLRIGNKYNASRPKGTTTREPEMLRAHWKRAADKIKEFMKCYNNAESHWSSGEADCDVLQNAKTLYAKSHKSPFLLLDAWELLRKIPKFHNPKSDSDKRQKGTDGSSYSSRSEEDSGFFSHQRPTGRDSSKGKKTVSDARTTVREEELDQMEKNNDKYEEALRIEAEGKILRARQKAFKCYQKAKKLDTSGMTDDELAQHHQMLEDLKAYYNKI